MSTPFERGQATGYVGGKPSTSPRVATKDPQTEEKSEDKTTLTKKSKAEKKTS